MIVIHKKQYNPKIDFLICKQLLCSVPTDSDELIFRDCFYGKKRPIHEHEKNIVELKKFFRCHEVERLTNTDVHELYDFLTTGAFDTSAGIFCEIDSFDDVVVLVNLIQQTSTTDKHTLFRILLLRGFCSATNEPLIPYRWLCRKLYDAITEKNIVIAQMFWARLMSKTEKLQLKHDIKENDVVLQTIKEYADDFVKAMSADALYIYGSLSVGKGTEYSDADLLAVFPGDINERNITMYCHEYWKDKISIPFDVMALSQENFAKLNHPAITKTLQKVGGAK